MIPETAVILWLMLAGIDCDDNTRICEKAMTFGYPTHQECVVAAHQVREALAAEGRNGYAMCAALVADDFNTET